MTPEAPKAGEITLISAAQLIVHTSKLPPPYIENVISRPPTFTTYTHLEKVVACNVSGQFGHRLPSGTPNPQEEGIALRLPQDAADPRHVFNGVQEHYKRHGLLGLSIVVQEVLVDCRLRVVRSRVKTTHDGGYWQDRLCLCISNPVRFTLRVARFGPFVRLRTAWK